MQGVLETALASLLGTAIEVIGAGRTDAGVHATGQVVNFRTASALPVGTIRRGVDALLPADVAVRALAEVGDDFHARHSATGRTYNYTIWNGETPRPLLRRTALWVDDPLDVAAMERAAAHLVGRHDFSAFSAKVEGARERTCRRAAWTRRDELVVFDVEADAFLRGMVRGMVGALLRVGHGKLDADGFAAVLASRERSGAAPAAPPQGLCLVRVGYEGTCTRDATTEEDGGDE